jgi:hypothetical protein
MKKINVIAGIQTTLSARVNMFDNNWKDILDRELSAQFHEKTYAKIKTMLDTSMNIFRRIVREICTVYREPAERTIVDAPETVQAAYAALVKELRIDQAMQVAHRYAKAATMSFVLVRYSESQERIVLRVLTPDQVIIESDPEDPTVMTLFAYASNVTDKDGKAVVIWTVYTETERWYAASDGNPLPADPRTGEVYELENLYGVIPAVPFPCEFQVRDFWNVYWNADASDANLKIGLLNTYMNYLVKSQSFKQITINSDHVSEELKDQILDPLFPLLLSGGAQAATLDLNTQLAAIDDVIRGKVAAIANNYGISQENFSLTTQAASGFSLKIANQSLQDIRSADVPLCEMVEQRLYKVIAAVAKAEEVATLPPESTLSFNPGEFSWPDEWATERDRWEFEFANGIASPVDYLIARDPQLDRDAAIALIQERQAEMKQLKPRVSAWDMIVEKMQGGESASPMLAIEAAKPETRPALPELAAAAEEETPIEEPARA